MCGMKLLIHSQNATVQQLGMDKLFHPTLYWTCYYSSMQGLMYRLLVLTSEYHVKRWYVKLRITLSCFVDTSGPFY